MQPQQDAYYELCYYTLAHPSPSFIHQHAVDAFAAQSADQATKPVTLVFALVGLHLCVEKGLGGRAVQSAHMRLAKAGKSWPVLALPADRGRISVLEVLAAPPGSERDQMIAAWCASVWAAYARPKPEILALLEAHHVG
jgi:Family of unknown function (DUF5946)